MPWGTEMDCGAEPSPQSRVYVCAAHELCVFTVTVADMVRFVPVPGRERVAPTVAEDESVPPHTDDIAARVFEPTTPNPVEDASPDETTLCAPCHCPTAAWVSAPKYPVIEPLPSMPCALRNSCRLVTSSPLAPRESVRAIVGHRTPAEDVAGDAGAAGTDWTVEGAVVNC